MGRTPNKLTFSSFVRLFLANLLLIVTLLMLTMVFLVAKHYKDEVSELKGRIRNLEIIIEKDGRNGK